MPNAPATPAQTARIVHLGLMGSVIMVTLVLALIPQNPAPVSPLFLYAVFGIAAILFAGALVISSRLPREASQSSDTWWSQNLGRAIIIWAMLEGPSMLGSVAYLLSRDWSALVIPMIGLTLFVVLGPSRLEQG